MRPIKLTNQQINYIRRAVRLRRKLTDKALAEKFGVSKNTVSSWGNGIFAERKRPRAQHTNEVRA